MALFDLALAGEDDHSHDDHGSSTFVKGEAYNIKGEIELKLSDAELVENNSFVVGVTRGLAKFLNISRSQVKVEFDHSGHDHRRLSAGDADADYEINFPAGTEFAPIDAVLDKMKDAKTNAAVTADLLKNIKTELDAAMPGAAAKVTALALKTEPAMAKVPKGNADFAMGSSCSGAVAAVFALALAYAM
eukprot:TRINITY_DN74573_c0_g1_i1.p1 TRINITY_DN74573_c0_g1~~TRINITY_DN74573_c0_g1_i1.p1  ORF type:complete len:212 (+),score=65.55 TRINITY_DN74573_c0_g1_i1:71-637(+)